MRTILNDSELVESLQKGNVLAFDKLFEKYAKRLYSFGYKYLRSNEEAEGLVQGVFLKVWDNRYNLRKESSFNSFIFTIAHHDICNIYRRRVKERDFKDKLILDSAENVQVFDHGSDYTSVLGHIMGIINQLPEKQRIAFIKSRFDGLSSKEIATELHLSPGTVDNYISATLKFIKTHLGSENLALILFVNLWIL